MFRRAKNFLADVLQQADMILLALCCAATLFGITMVYSATRYMQTNRLVIIQGWRPCAGRGAVSACLHGRPVRGREKVEVADDVQLRASSSCC